MKVLVTGGAGFIGRHLLRRVSKDYQLQAILHRSPSANEDTNFTGLDAADIVCGDVSDPETWTRAIGTDAIIALASSHRSVSCEKPLRDLDVNYKATILGLEHARHNRACFIFASNAGIVSNAPRVPVDETFEDTPTTPYDIHKLASEHLMSVYSAQHGVRTLAFRLASVYGPGQLCRRELGRHPLIPHFFTLMHHGNTPTIDGDGEQTRDFIYVEDVVRSLLRGLEKLTCNETDAQQITGQKIILGTNTSVTVNRVYDLIANYVHSSAKPRHGPAKPADVRRMQYSYTKAAQLLDWHPEVGFEEGLALTLDWLRKQQAMSGH